MTLDCNEYRANFEYIKNLFADKSEEEREEMIGHISVATNVPIIVVICYLSELHGWTPFLLNKFENLCNFYHIEQVINTSFEVENGENE